jgi:hypothetical protein
MVEMRVFAQRFGWKPIDTAPFDQDATLFEAHQQARCLRNLR